MKLRDTFNNLKVVFIGKSDDVCLANAIKCEFSALFNQFKILTTDDWHYGDIWGNYDVAILDIDSVKDLYILEEMSYVNPNLYFIIISDNDYDSFILQCFKYHTFAYMQKSQLKSSIKSCAKLRRLEIALAHFALLRKSYSIIHISNRISIECLREAIYLDNKELFLSPKLKKIFWLLYANCNRVVPYSHLLSIVFDEEANIDSLRMSIVRIKKLLQNNEVITNISGYGYMLVSKLGGGGDIARGLRF